MDAQKKVDIAYRNQSEWARKAMLNMANAGKFSSDRTIEEYANEIWKLDKIKVLLPEEKA